MPDLIAGVNSYVTLAEADAYLAGSVQQAAAWAGHSDDVKQLALISAFRALERERWEGVKTGVRQVASAVFVAAGTLYAVGDLVQLQGGTRTVAPLLEVLTVGGGGELQTFKLLHTGFFTAEPASPVSSVALTGVGVGATFDLTMVDQLMEWPRTITGCSELDVPVDSIPTDIQAAQCELGAVFAADPSQEGNVGAGAAGTSSNIKKVEAGSAKVTYFRPTTGTPYPTVTWQLISQYREGACSDSGAYGMMASGTGDCSAFTNVAERYGLNTGYA